jgi:hypothetical protein
MLSLSAVSFAISRIISPIRATASMSIPERLDATFMEEHTHSVSDKACGIELISFVSLGIQPFCTSAEYPPMKFTPIIFAALSSVFAIEI